MAKGQYALIRANAPEGDLARIIGRLFVDPEKYVVPRGRALIPWADAQAAGYTYAAIDPKEAYKQQLRDDLRNAIAANRTFIAQDPSLMDLLTATTQLRRLTGQMNRVIRYLEANFDPSEPT